MDDMDSTTTTLLPSPPRGSDLVSIIQANFKHDKGSCWQPSETTYHLDIFVNGEDYLERQRRSMSQVKAKFADHLAEGKSSCLKISDSDKKITHTYEAVYLDVAGAAESEISLFDSPTLMKNSRLTYRDLTEGSVIVRYCHKPSDDLRLDETLATPAIILCLTCHVYYLLKDRPNKRCDVLFSSFKKTVIENSINFVIQYLHSRPHLQSLTLSHLYKDIRQYYEDRATEKRLLNERKREIKSITDECKISLNRTRSFTYKEIDIDRSAIDLVNSLVQGDADDGKKVDFFIKTPHFRLFIIDLKFHRLGIDVGLRGWEDGSEEERVIGYRISEKCVTSGSESLLLALVMDMLMGCRGFVTDSVTLQISDLDPKALTQEAVGKVRGIFEQAIQKSMLLLRRGGNKKRKNKCEGDEAFLGPESFRTEREGMRTIFYIDKKQDKTNKNKINNQDG